MKRRRVMLVNESTMEVADVYKGDARVGKPVGAYVQPHWGNNQMWRWNVNEDAGAEISSCLDEVLCLGVEAEAKAEARVVLTRKKATKKAEGRRCLRFRLMHGRFVVMAGGASSSSSSSSSLALAQVCEGESALALLELDENDERQMWRVEAEEEEEEEEEGQQEKVGLLRRCRPKPATSCHLRYRGLAPSSSDLSSEWALECAVTVEESADCTYFCVVGWSPGGYSGIQQVDEKRRVAIFSMWDDREAEEEEGGSVQEVEKGEGVTVTAFGGEGTGLKSMRDLDWREGESVTFRVTGKRVVEEEEEEEEETRADGKETWICSCHYSLEGKEEEEEAQLMATFRRRSRRRPLHRDGFYSFVEDWDRSDGAEGHLRMRAATFRGAAVRTGKSRTELREATFTKVRSGWDAYAAERATGGVCEGGAGFFLSTGGTGAEHGTVMRLPD